MRRTVRPQRQPPAQAPQPVESAEQKFETLQRKLQEQTQNVAGLQDELRQLKEQLRQAEIINQALAEKKLLQTIAQLKSQNEGYEEKLKKATGQLKTMGTQLKMQLQTITDLTTEQGQIKESSVQEREAALTMSRAQLALEKLKVDQLTQQYSDLLVFSGYELPEEVHISSVARPMTLLRDANLAETDALTDKTAGDDGFCLVSPPKSPSLSRRSSSGGGE